MTRPLLYPCLVMLVLSACSRPADAPDPGLPTDAALAEALVGAWCVSDDGGKTCIAYDVYESPTSVLACGASPAGDAFRLRARVTVDGHRTCFEITESSETRFSTVGHRFCSTVLALDGRQHRYRFDGGDKVDTTYRVAADSVRCPALPAARPASAT